MVELRLLRRGRAPIASVPPPPPPPPPAATTMCTTGSSSHHDARDSKPNNSLDYPERTSSHYRLSPSPTPDHTGNVGGAAVLVTTTTTMTTNTSANGPPHQFTSRRSTSTSTAPVAPYATGPKESPRTRIIKKLIQQITSQLPSHSTSRHPTGSGYPSVGQRVTREATKGLEGVCKSPGAIQEVLTGLLRELERPAGSGRGDGARNMSSAPSAPLLSSLNVLRSHCELLRVTTSCLLAHWWSHVQRSSTSTEPVLDPPALDENLARSLLNVVVPTGAFVPSSISMLSASPSCTSSLVSRVFRSLDSTSSSQVADLIDSPFSSSETREDLRSDIHHYAALVVYFLSASNWTLIQNLLRQRLASHSGPGATPNELPSSNGTAMEFEAHDLRMLESCCMSRSRLSAIFQDVFNAFLHLRKPAQLVIVLALRSSVWSWITSRPEEYRAMVQLGRRLEGGCDMLFDLLWAQSAILVPDPSSSAALSASASTPTSQNLTRRMSPTPTSSWPTMMMLLLCCPDIVQQLTNDEDAVATDKPSGGYSKKKQFLDAIKAALSNSTGGSSEYAQNACVDLLMASHQIVEPSSSIAALASDCAKVFMTSLMQAVSESPIQRATLTRCLVAIAKVQVMDEGDLVKLFSRLMETDSALAHQLGTVNALLILFSDHGSTESWSTISKSLCTLFSYATRLPRPIRRARQGSAGAIYTDPSTVAEDASPVLIRSMLVLWSKAPHLLIADAEITLVAVAELARDLLDETIDRLAFGVILACFQSFGQRTGTEDDTVDWSELGKIVAHRILEADDATMCHCLLLRVMLEIIKQPLSKKVGGTWKWSEAFWNALEASLLVSALSPSDETSELALECARQVLLVHGAAVPSRSVVKPLGQARDLSSKSDTLRHLKLYIQDLDEASMGLLIAWDELTRRAGDLAASHIFHSHHTSPTSYEGSPNMAASLELNHWSSLTGLLLVMSWVCTRMAGSDEGSTGLVDSRMARRNERARQANAIVYDLVEQSVVDDPIVRTHATELLANNLDVRRLAGFVMQLKKSAQRLSTTDQPDSDLEDGVFSNMLFITQSLVILQALVTRVDSSGLHRDVYAPMVEVVVVFAEFISTLSIQDERLRLQSKLSTLCENVQTKSGELDEISAPKRIKLVEYLYRWISVTDDRAGQRAFSALLKGLKLQAPDGTPDRAVFNRYFDHFTRVLTGMAGVEVESRIAGDLNRTKAALMEGFAALLASNQKMAMATRRISEMTCSKLQDPLRHIYIEVLTLLLAQGVKFDIDNGASSTDSAYRQISQLIRHSPSSLALALCEVCPPAKYDNLIEVLLRIMSTPSATVRFLRAVIAAEVSATDHESTLFRGNTFASRLLTIYSKVQGYRYLRETLRELLLAICSKPPEFNLDFDPHRDSSDEDVASRNLIQVTEAFLVRIAQSADAAPDTIREICALIAEAVGARFPESVFTAIGGFIFLRLINPAIVSPEMIDLDLVDQAAGTDAREVRKGLVSVSKILQALANNVRFGAKEPGMRAINPFMDRNIFTMTSFLSSMSRPPSAQRIETLDTANQDRLSPANLAFLHSFLVDNCSKIGSKLLNYPDCDANDLWETLTGLIAALAPVKQAELDLCRPGERTNETLASFMAQNAFRINQNEANKWSEVFYRSPVTAHPRAALFVYCPRRIDAETVDVEGLTFWALHCLTTFETEHWDILIDLTGISNDNILSPAHMQRFLRFVPEPIVKRLSQAVLFSPNFCAQAYLRRVETRMGSFDVRMVVACYHLEDLARFLPTSALPASTLALAREPRVTYNRITLKHPVRVEVPVLLQLGSTAAYLTTVKPHPIAWDLTSVFCEMAPFDMIDDVRLMNTNRYGDEIMVRMRDGDGDKSWTLLIESEAAEILEELRARCTASSTKALLVTQAISSMRSNRSPLACISTLAMVSCTSPDAELRADGYRLARALGKALGAFEGMSDLSSSYLPSGDLVHLSSLSETLSAVMPPQLALDVVEGLVEVIARTGRSLTQAIGSIYALRSWLHHLPSALLVPTEQISKVRLRLRHIFRTLLRKSVEDPHLGAALTARFWPAMGRLEAVHDLVLDQALDLVPREDLSASEAAAAKYGDVLATLAASPSFRGRVLGRIRRALAEKAAAVTTAVPSTPPNAAQTKQDLLIAVALRFDLSLSFEAKVSTQILLPEIVHIVMCLAGEGSISHRQTLRQLIQNTISSLALDEQADRKRLSDLSKAFESEAVLELMGLRSRGAGAVADWDVLRHGERLATALGEIIEAGAPGTDTENAWRTRWASLTSTLCFQYDAALQGRAVATLSYLGSTALDDDVVFQLLTTLSNAIRSPDGVELAVLLTRCLSKTLQSESKFLLATTETGMALLLARPSLVSRPAVALLAVAIEKLQISGAFIDTGALEMLGELWLAHDVQSMPAQIGVSFELDLGFALASLLARLSMDAKTASDATYCLLSIIHHSHPLVEDNQEVPKQLSRWLGPFIALLPTMVDQGRLPELLSAARIDTPPGVSNMPAIAAKLEIPDQNAVSMYAKVFYQLAFADPYCHLSQALMCLALSTRLLEDMTASDAAAAALFHVIARTLTLYPDLESLFSETLARTLDTYLSRLGSDPLLYDAMNSIPSGPTASNFSDAVLLDQLNRLGFGSLAPTFKAARGRYSIDGGGNDWTSTTDEDVAQGLISDQDRANLISTIITQALAA
ncbi:BZ3500_MvSof-1268-A1-R1_Chr11-3g03557 [Microbotryum saponariae]|uniref:BZ3500_MvSof-1268-A1-R1_Chr11-3g03557 protein n=1 Tax=Microbotryum saponariae TaxID=289078 RepID=A0A2X0KMP3_9BASI|nr:BZ3500_MvSof-1268-A1-R1_Chr11-3g03557 [Microbotryum saponariae]SDA03566.1 BZ3501_MvSof-1269-A2-R1_Chr11g03134 [Microbotryum saponariae]